MEAFLTLVLRDAFFDTRMLYGPYVQVVRIGLKRFFVSWDTPPPVRGLDPTVPFPTQFLFSVGLIGHLF